jgi:hypothetical protein
MSRRVSKIILVLILAVTAVVTGGCVSQPACAPAGPNVEFCGA